VLGAIRNAGMKPGVCINPGSPLELVEPVLELADLLVVMSVNPGWGGQAFIEGSLDRIEAARAIRDRLHPSMDIEVDGGVTAATGRQAASSGDRRAALAAPQGAAYLFSGGAQAAGADHRSLPAALDHHPGLVEVGHEATLRAHLGVTHVMAELWPFSANFAALCHLNRCSPPQAIAYDGGEISVK
jgi:hypothetical protein